MNIVALDTSMGSCGAAVLRQADGAAEIVLREERMPRGHAERLMPMLAAVMEEAKLASGDIDLVAATLGPGSFTGVRIAIAAARALSLVTGAKLWGADSLTVMARTAQGSIKTNGAPFAIAVATRDGMLYFGLYSGSGARLSGPSLLSPLEAASLLPPDVVFAAGSGAALLAEAVRGGDLDAVLPDLEPSAASLAKLALVANATLDTLHPLYLRPPDAKPQAAAIIARAL